MIHSGMIQPKTTKSTQGISVMNLKKGHRLIKAEEFIEGKLTNPNRYRTKNIPALGALPKKEDPIGEQLKL